MIQARILGRVNGNDLWSTIVIIICRIFRKLENKSGMIMVSNVKTQKSSESHPVKKITGSQHAELNLFPVIWNIFHLRSEAWLVARYPPVSTDWEMRHRPLPRCPCGILFLELDKKRRLVLAKNPAVFESYELTNIMTDCSSSRWLAASWSGTWPGCWPPPWPCTGSSMATCSGATPSSPSASVSSSPAWWAGWEGPASPSVLWGEVARQLS